MNQETNKEMDLLLRRLGRREEPSVSNDGNHLDADELSTYAENALPAVARSRYTEHLADCSTCRQLVAQLSSAAGVAIVADTAVAPEPSWLRRFLASLFSPLVLRYAGPALGLIVVAVIGLVILRQNRPHDFVSQVTNEQRSAPTAQPAPSAAGELAYDSQEKTASSREAQITESDKNKQTTAPPPPNNAPVVSVQVELSGDTAAGKANAPAEQQKAAAPAAQPSATPAASRVAIDETAGKEPEPKKQETEQAAVTVKPGEKSRADFRVAEDRKAEESRGMPAPAAKRTAVGAASTAKPAEAETGRDEGTETRSVAGRRFRKRSGIWIDTAYDSARETMTLTRGSDRYRALVADEPAIKTIADELEGEIIVVWKGRVYRIR
jgi:hypothetical protein